MIVKQFKSGTIIHKGGTCLLLYYTFIAAFVFPMPNIAILGDTVRNLFFHVPMWFAMYSCFLIGTIWSCRELIKQDYINDIKASSYIEAGFIFGCLGLITGSIWARFTWGTWWTFSEPRMNFAAMAMFIYITYFILRSSITEETIKAKVSAIYAIITAVALPFVLYVIPRQLPSLHPGAEGNPAFSDITDPLLRWIFYPAVIGFIGLCIWIAQIRSRQKQIVYLISIKD